MTTSTLDSHDAHCILGVTARPFRVCECTIAHTQEGCHCHSHFTDEKVESDDTASPGRAPAGSLVPPNDTESV